MSDPIKWLDRDNGPVDYGEPTYWERRCKCAPSTAIVESQFRHLHKRGRLATRVWKVKMQFDHFDLRQSVNSAQQYIMIDE